MSGYVKTFGDKNNKIMPSHIYDKSLLGKYKIIWSKIEDWKILNWILYQLM